MNGIESFDPLNGGMKTLIRTPARPPVAARALDPPRPTAAAALLLASALSVPFAVLVVIQALL